MDRLKRKRSTIRARTTAILNKIERETSKQNSEIDIALLDECYEQLTFKETGLQELDRQIEELTVDLEELEIELNASQEYEEKIISGKSKVSTRIKELNSASSVASEISTSIRPAAQVQRQATVKLPRLILSKYNGDTSKWLQFWGQFECAIHNNRSLNKIEKLNYLLSYLEGIASSAVSGLSLTEDSYDVAVELLLKRFGKRDVVINAHMQRLLDLSPVERSDDVVALRQLFDACEIQVRNLETMGVVSNAYGTLLCPILMKLIPSDIVLEFTRNQADDDEGKVMDLLNFLRKEVESRERVRTINNNDPGRHLRENSHQSYSGNHSQFTRENKQTQRYQRNRNQLATAATLNVGAKKDCIYCGSVDHAVDFCKEISLEEKMEKLKKLGRCFLCLDTNHQAKRCWTKKGCSLCGRRHHRSICKKLKECSLKDPLDKSTMVSSPSTSNTTAALSSAERGAQFKTVLLQTAMALAVGRHSMEAVRCLFDGGSQQSFIKESVSRELNLPVVGEETLNLHIFGSDKPNKITSRKVRVILQNVQFPERSIELEVLEVPQICSAIISLPGESVRKEMAKRGLLLADNLDNKYLGRTTEISILIGSDHYWKMISGKVERLGKSLVALEGLLGWTIQGTSSVPLNTSLAAVGVFKAVIEEENISTNLRRFWELESLGVNPDNSETERLDIIGKAESSIIYQDGRYEVGLPFKLNRPRLHSNYRIASQRLKNLIRRTQLDAILWEKYKETIEEYKELGIVEPADEKMLDSDQNEVYYIPHHPVIREDKSTTKLRIVFDASSHERNRPSLNDCLEIGPNLNPDLLAVILRFRIHKIAFMADVEKAFLQISLAEDERDFVRFLWVKERPTEGEPLKFDHYRMTRILFGVSSSPFLLAFTLRHHFSKWKDIYPEVCALLADNMYVDDLISGADTEERAQEIHNQAKEIVSSAGMNLRKWVTNSEALGTQWQEENSEGHTTCMDKGIKQSSTSLFKVLGLTWKAKDDILTFDVSALLEVLETRENTKRSVLSASARIFDPIGLLSPFLIRVKCLFQELWVRGLDWDMELPPDLQESWDSWCLELTKLKEVIIPRWYYANSDESRVSNRQLHMFSDASERAYGAVIYLRYTTETGETGVSLVTSKTRVAPLKRQTLPRLELMAALIGARLLRFCLNAIPQTIDSYRCWSDSTITIHWIKGLPHHWKPFVANRVTEIQSLTGPEFWDHVSGRENPADYPSRGLKIEEILHNDIWWTGPPWLLQGRETWPNHSESEFPGSIEATQERRNIIQTSCAAEETRKPILEVDKYSTFSRLIRVTSWTLRFINNARNPKGRIFGALATEEFEGAERYWVKFTQERAYSEEMTLLRSGKQVSKESPIASLNPFIDEDVIRVGGRLQFSNMQFEEKHPLILPPNHRLTELIIKHRHEMSFHSGVSELLTDIREKYWIPRGRQIVKKLINQCFVCRRFKARRGAEIAAPLPSDRVLQAPPFEVTGVDFAGPMYVKENVGRGKAYIAIFTCGVTRAVHLELVPNMGADSFLLAFRRFIARRGLCRVIYSDNAKSFKKAEKDLAAIIQRVEVDSFKNFLGHRKIQWKYIVERAAWWGGFWERMVRSMKFCLRKVLGKSLLSAEELVTILAEVEAVLNSRPLTTVSSDSDDSVPLTPGHFLIGQRLTSLPPSYGGTRTTTSNTKDTMVRRLRYRETIMNGFWKRWKHEYLMELRSAHSSKLPKNVREFKFGDVVLLEENKLPRQVWKMGRIIDVFPGRDGKIRSCAVQFPDGILKRPIQLLYPMELDKL